MLSKHVKLEDEHQKSLAPPSLALVAKGSKLKGNRPFRGIRAKKGQYAPQNSQPEKGIAKKQKAKGNGDKNIARVKCYNCGRKGHYARDCPKPSKVCFPTKTPDVNVCSHAFIANSLPQWIVDTRVTKHIVQNKAGFVEFHRYSMGSQTAVLGNSSKEVVLGVGTYQLRPRGGTSCSFMTLSMHLGCGVP